MAYKKYHSAPTKYELSLRAERLKKQLKRDINPINISGRNIAESWWGKAWNKNLKEYADFSNRISRGSSYVRSGSVVDLVIENGEIQALVSGSSNKPYQVNIAIKALDDQKWELIKKECKNKFSSLSDLSNGKMPKELEVLLRNPDYGLFPTPNDIHFNCSCPDYAYMCKHVAATLLGVGNRLDDDPLMFFKLRQIDSNDLIQSSVEEKLESMFKNIDYISDRVIEDSVAKDLFGL
jgi:uncharacterized Zn finger protein